MRKGYSEGELDVATFTVGPPLKFHVKWEERKARNQIFLPLKMILQIAAMLTAHHQLSKASSRWRPDVTNTRFQETVSQPGRQRPGQEPLGWVTVCKGLCYIFTV